MERELVWKQVYRAIKTISQVFPESHSGPGRPDVHPTGAVVICWMWSCLWREPVAMAMAVLRSSKKRRLYRELGYRLPERIPDGTTVSRRMRRPDFAQFMEAVQHLFVDKLLEEQSCQTLIVDSSPLDIPTISHDSDARYGHHGHFGYRLHTLVTQDRIILEEQTLATNEHELAVFPLLVEQAAARGIRCRFLAADVGYDSEPAHRSTREQLGGMLLAPLNDRGAEITFTTTPLRKQMWENWNMPEVKAARRKRPGIERVYSILKGPLAMDSLPRHIRGLRRVRSFLTGEIVLYHGHLLASRLKKAA